MTILKHSDHRLSNAEIKDWLRALRSKPYTPGSNFDVTAVFRVKLGEDANYYVAGVNTENMDNRLSTHGEEGAIIAMTTAFGGKAEMMEGWVMGAPKQLKQGDSDALANNAVNCCGKCRQQLTGFAELSMPMHSVTLNGDIPKYEHATLGAQLANAFSVREFAPEKIKERQAGPAPSFEEAQQRLYRMPDHELSNAEILAWQKELEPIDFMNHTKRSAIVQLSNGAYVAGVGVDDAAYISIDPVVAAVSNANALFDGKERVGKVWLYGQSEETEKNPKSFIPLYPSGQAFAAQFGAFRQIPICVMNGQETAEYKLTDAARYTPTYDGQTIEIGPERYIK